MKIDGRVVINSSSVDLGIDDVRSSLYVNKVSLINEDGIAEGTLLENEHINKIVLVGKYEVVIDGKGR